MSQPNRERAKRSILVTGKSKVNNETAVEGKERATNPRGEQAPPDLASVVARTSQLRRERHNTKKIRAIAEPVTEPVAKKSADG